MTLPASDFDFVRTLLERETSIVIGPDQRYLVESRLTSVARAAGCAEVSAFMSRLPREPGLRQQVIEALTVHETSFFRDRHPFQALEQVIFPELMLLRAKERRLHIWSAAASTGQEAYSVAMLLLESFPLLREWKIHIVGTDVSDGVIAQAKAGTYSPLEVGRGLPSKLLLKYFERRATSWVARPELRKLVRWHVMNLTNVTPSFTGFDLVLLRNVLIYFDPATRRRILCGMAQRVRHGGYLMLGSTESANECKEWTPRSVEKTTLYLKSP